MNRCPKCRGKARVLVELYLDIPAELEHLLSKKNLRRKDVKVMGAGWPKCRYYCAKGCGWSLSWDEKG